MALAFVHLVDVFGVFGPVGDEPSQPFGKLRQSVQGGSAERRGGAQRQQTDHRPHPQRLTLSARDLKYVVIEAVFLVPQTAVVDGFGDQREVLEEFGCHVLIRLVSLSQH